MLPQIKLPLMNPEIDTQLRILRADGLDCIRNILDVQNQQTYFEVHSNDPPLNLQMIGTTMLFCALEQNSDLLYNSLKHLNSLHKFYPDIRFHYNKSIFCNSTHKPWTDLFFKDFLSALYSCTESTFNGARQEALEFFKYWMQDDVVASDVFKRICFSWPWTNRNKYYFLAIIFERHNFYDMLRQYDIEPQYFIRGVVISLQYRNLISPGQNLIVQLSKLNINELYIVIADVLRNASEFELHNCVQWLHCIFHLEQLYHLLDLSNENILIDEKFSYLLVNNMEKLVLFRRAFKISFEKHIKLKEIDHMIVTNYKTVGLVHRAAIFEILITNTITHVERIEENLSHLQNFLKDNMNHEHSALRQDIMKLMPNLFYLLSSMLKSSTNEIKEKIKKFFQFLKLQIFDIGVKETQYQSVIFSLRLYEILLKLLFGCKGDRLIKEFNVDKNKRLRSFLIDEEVWDLCSMEHCNTLINLVQSDFDDVRDISTELLVRFYPMNSVENLYQPFMVSSDINHCKYSHLFARIALRNNEAALYVLLKQFLITNLSDYDDPFQKTKTGSHLFGAVNCINEFYRSNKYTATTKEKKLNIAWNTTEDVNLTEQVTEFFLRLLRSACDSNEANGSPSFEKMDESLEYLLSTSSYPITNILEDKKYLLLSIWHTLKSCCELASNIGVVALNTSSKAAENNVSQKEIVEKCFNISSNVLLHCRHKGAIEAAGLSLGKIVKSITMLRDSDSEMFNIVTNSVERIFDIINKTDTTRRGAGFSIMVLNLVKNDYSKDKVVVKLVMNMLLAKYDSAHELPPEQTNRDNLHASILHFFCVLFKDGDLKSSLSGYMVKVFSIAISQIESDEWTIRNAALQLFGAIVPKLVGQNQYFINPHISWEPVSTAYNDIIIKMHGIYCEMFAIVCMHRSTKKSSVLLVSVLELLSRVDVIGQQDDILAIRTHVLRLIAFDSEKIRNLAAKSLTRLHELHEIVPTIMSLVPQLFETNNENYKHGLVISLLYLLQKFESDVRFTGNTSNAKDLFKNTRTWILRHFKEQSNSYYLRCYLLNFLLYIGFEMYDSFVLKIIFETDSVRSREDIDQLLAINADCRYDQFGVDLWKQKIKNIYLDCKLNEEIEI